jgi:hypothetical protein
MTNNNSQKDMLKRAILEGKVTRRRKTNSTNEKEYKRVKSSRLRKKRLKK